VSNEAGSDGDVSTLIVGVVIEADPMDVLANITDTVNFTCLVSGSENITYTWFHGNGTGVELTSRTAGVSSPTLTISPVVSSDFGEYFCTASNNVNSVQSRSALLTVSPLGTVNVSPAALVANESDVVNLSCAAEGGPNNTLMWLFDGTPINSSAFLTVTVSTAVDGGVYSCQVSNDAGSGSNSGRVFVNPVVMTNPIGANVPVLTNYTVECEVRGSSPPTIFWFQNGTAINATSDERFTVVMTTTRVLARSELTIVNATFEDSGLYQCVGRPDFPGGTPVGSDQVNITVQGIPERPIDVSVVNVTHNSAQLEWVEPHDNNAEITGYSVLVRDLTNMTFHSNQNTTGAVEMLTVTGLSPFTNYSFVVVAVNSLGNSPPSEPVVNRTDEFFPTAPLNLTEVSTTSDSIFVTWSPPSSPNGVLLSYNVSHRRADGNVFTRLSVSPSMTTANLTSLSSFVTYNIFVRAETAVGFGPMSNLISVRTNTSEPGPVSNIVVANTSSTSVRITFDEPDPPNGVITQYQVIVVRASEHRDRRAVVGNVTVTAPTSTHNLTNDTREVNIGGFLEFSENTVCLRAFTFVGPGENVCTTFVTAEDTPLAPLNLQVLNVSSTSLNVTWNRPESIRGVLIAYEIVYVSSEGASQAVNITNFSATNAEVLGGLTINTEYNVTLRAFTRAGPGIPITAQGFTNEDAPPVIGNVQVNQMLSNDGNLELSWDPPSTRNGEYRYELFYSFVSSFTHVSRVEMNSSDRIILSRLDGLEPRTMFVISNSTSSRVRSFASYQFSIMGCNILFGTCNIAVNGSLVTHITRATPVTELMAVPMVTDNPQSFNIKVSWDLPEFPNGPIDMYQVKYFPSDAPSNSRMEEVAVGNGPVSYVIMTTTPFTNYTITIMPIGQTTIGFENTIVQRTNQSAPMSVDNLADTASDYRCITVTVPVPTEDSGIIRQFDVIVTLQPTNPTSNRTVCNLSLSLAHRRDLTIVSDQPNPGAVPNQVAANQRRTICELDPNTAYYVFTRTEYFQDGTMDNVVCSEPSMLMTLNESLVAGLVIFFFILIAVIVVLVIVIILLMYRRKRKDVYSPSDIPLSPTETEKEQVFVNLAIPQWTATMDPVSVKDFPGHVRHLHADDDYRFSEEYKNVEPEHSPTTEAFSNPVNATKNRYGNITAYDHSRVRLTPVEGVAGSDYINANFLDGYKMPSAYIATQGTVPDSISDFWRMVWEYNAPTIIMLTNLEERGRVKCHKYWPSKTDSYGDIRVTLQDEVVLTEYTVRTYSVIKSGHREERIIKQYHYTSWPDFGVPSHPTPLLTFVRRVSANHPTDKGPMVVHCSAGVGRSGTFITVHSQLKRIAAEGNIDIYGFVRAMRYRRCLMVQTEAQYIFIHDALLEAVECGVTEIQARDLPSHYKKLQTTDESTGKTLLELELQRLNASIHKKPQQSEGTKPANRGKNRFADILPYDTTRCRLSSVIGVAGSDYINANFINGYTMKNAFIATQGPLPDTIADFWRMVWEYKCHTVIMLTKEKESGRVRCHKYWPDGNDMYGQLQVVQLTETPYSEYVLREFKLIDTKDKSSLPVKHFQFLGWPEESGKVPSHGADLIDLIGQVQKWQRTAGTAPVIVHCSGGSGRTGTFITIANLLDCLKSEGVVDVFQTVRTLRLQRPNMVRTVEQYRYCYTTVLEYLESFDLYANFK
jgi:netrin-G3 ligand